LRHLIVHHTPPCNLADPTDDDRSSRFATQDNTHSIDISKVELSQRLRNAIISTPGDAVPVLIAT
jgi:hypothetical protein